MLQHFRALRRWAPFLQTNAHLEKCNSAVQLSSIAGPSTANVPAGHHNSDLSSVTCNIGLGRRRDLTLRQDLKLHEDGRSKSLAEVFKGLKVLLVGFPGGSVCTEKHIPGYFSTVEQLCRKGVDKVVCVSISQPGPLKEWATKNGFSHSKVEFLADQSAGFMRLLGLELPHTDSSAGPKCQRFAAIVEDGLLLKLQVESSPAELKVSDASHMVKLWEEVYPSQ